MKKIELFFVWLLWLFTDPADRKPWNLVKKGMEPHEHNFIIPYSEGGYRFWKCDHPGCNLCEPRDETK